MLRPAALLLLPLALHAQIPAPARATLQKHCAACHGPSQPAANLSIAKLLANPDPPANREHWEKIAAKLRSGEMPPKPAPRPSPAEIDQTTAWIARTYEALDKSQPIDPGRVTARRLNRVEYANSVRDLLGLPLVLPDDLPADPYGYGFDNIGDVLSTNSALTEQYLKAAERIAAAAIPVPNEPAKPTLHRYLAERIGQDRQLHVQVDHVFPADGLYSLRTAFYQALRDGTRVRIHLSLDGRPVADGTLKFYYQIDRALDAPKIPVTAGRHRIDATIEVLPDPPYKGAPPFVEYLQIHGPLELTPPAPRPFLTCADPTPACTKQILAPLARRAFRRPVAPAELDTLLSLAAREQARTGSWHQALRTSLMAILVSPHFLFRIERDPVSTAHPVTPHELATRLSYFLWSTLPDPGLAARLPHDLHTETDKLLDDPRASAFVENFAGQWLQTRNLAVLKPDPKLFPQFTGELAAAMRTETELFFAELLRENRPIFDLLDAPFTYLNEPLAKHYGIPNVTGPQFRRVALDGVQRSGVLTHASVLTISSYPTRTSPVIRGKWILETLLNQPPPPPPPNVPGLEEKAAATGSMRQQLEKHRTNPACAACHARMDPLGFGLENYDAIGRWRAEDASGELPGGVRFANPAELKQILKSDRDLFASALAEKMLTYALGRGVELRDRPALRKIVDRLRASDYRLRALVHAIVESEPFLQRRPEAQGAKP